VGLGSLVKLPGCLFLPGFHISLIALVLFSIGLALFFT
jgi:hypothetical protein